MTTVAAWATAARSAAKRWTKASMADGSTVVVVIVLLL